MCKNKYLILMSPTGSLIKPVKIKNITNFCFPIEETSFSHS